MAGEVEHVHDAFPCGLTVVSLVDGHGLDERGDSAVLDFNGPLELERRYVISQIVTPVLGWRQVSLSLVSHL